jgi:hypothetical protein
MTLNITLASKWAIYQSSDFKLTKNSGPRLVIQDMPQKQAVLQYLSWVGLVSYTGIAVYNSHNTLAWLTKILTHPLSQRSQNMILKALRDEGNKWITRVPAADRYHTFTVVTFDAKGPRIVYISTFQRAGGHDLPTPRPTFFITSFRPGQPWFGATGSGAKYVSQQDKAMMLDNLGKNESPLAIRKAVAEVNRNTAPRTNGTVSEQCISSHLLPDRTGEAQVFGDIDKPFIPMVIMSGGNSAKDVPDVLADAGETTPNRLVGLTWSSGGVKGDRWSATAAAYRKVR